MNCDDDSLHKLLKAASRAPQDRSPSPPFGFETAVLARWRAKRKDEDLGALLWLFRRATIFAVVIMTLSGALNYFGNNSNEGTTALANYAMMQFPP